MVRESPPQPPPYPAEKARGARIVMRAPWQRVLFVAGLALPVIVLVVLLAAA